MVEASRIKGPFNTWAVNFLKGHTRAIRVLYPVMDIDKGYGLAIARRGKNQ